MEFIVWYLGKESRAQKLCETYGQGWPMVELSQFMGDYLFVPLFSLLIENARPIGYAEILDEHLYSEPDLQDQAKLLAGTAEGQFVQRVNPEFVSLLAAISPSLIDALADKWYAATEMQEFYQSWDEGEARPEVVRMLTELAPLARRAVAEKKVLMQLSCL